MAKRKRLTSAALTGMAPAAPETPPPRRAPIAHVAGDAAATAALQDLAGEMQAARATGRFVQSLPLQAIAADHLIRDRLVQDKTEMAALKASLAARGQQTPVEVVELGGETYGLISGHRRLTALQGLFEETGEARFAQVLALIKPLEGAAASYTAMVEENEIRANLSFYERARLAAEAARIGVYPTPARAVAALFANAPAAKRSKIASFLRVHADLGPALAFPAVIPEKLGLALSKALQADAGFAPRLKAGLRKAPDRDAEQERMILERSLKSSAPKGGTEVRQLRADLALHVGRGQVTVKGAGVTPELIAQLEQWLARR